MAQPLPVGMVKVRVILVLGFIHPLWRLPHHLVVVTLSSGVFEVRFSHVLPLQPGGPIPEKMEVHVEQGQLQCHSWARLHYSLRGIYTLLHGNSSFALNLRMCWALP